MNRILSNISTFFKGIWQSKGHAELAFNLSNNTFVVRTNSIFSGPLIADEHGLTSFGTFEHPHEATQGTQL
jgi:hypothetical protein